MSTDDVVEDAARIVALGLPYDMAVLLVRELRTCRRVLREIQRLSEHPRATTLADIHMLAVAALKDPPPP